MEITKDPRIASQGGGLCQLNHFLDIDPIPNVHSSISAGNTITPHTGLHLFLWVKSSPELHNNFVWYGLIALSRIWINIRQLSKRRSELFQSQRVETVACVPGILCISIPV